MTCIAALKHNGKIYMASDCQTSYGVTSFMSSRGKVFKKGTMLIGCSGNSRFDKIIEYNFNPPEHSASIGDMEYLNSVFVDSLRVLCGEKEYSTVTNSKPSTEGCALIGYNGNIYMLASDFDVSTYDINYHAIGSGTDFAIGSMYSTEKLEMDPEKRLILAVQSAINYDVNCGGEVVIISS